MVAESGRGFSTMLRFVVLGFAICAFLGGCAVGTGPSLSNLGLSENESGQAKPEVADASAFTKSADNSMLNSIWDNFSSAFRSGEFPSPALKAVNKPEVDNITALRLVNEFRATKGLQPLSLEPRATQAAKLLAEYMAKHDHMSHYGQNGADVGARLTSFGYQYHLAAENIGAGQSTLKEIIEGWGKSLPHRKNMLLADAKDMGIALDYNPDSKYKSFWTLVIAAP